MVITTAVRKNIRAKIMASPMLQEDRRDESTRSNTTVGSGRRDEATGDGTGRQSRARVTGHVGDLRPRVTGRIDGVEHE
jgi:hypothetical protein